MYVYNLIVFVFFFFKQKTAYEMRISDWSSDVCSSDLAGQLDVYDTIVSELRDACEDVILNRKVEGEAESPTERLIALAERYKGSNPAPEKAAEQWSGWDVPRRREPALVQRSEP